MYEYLFNLDLYYIEQERKLILIRCVLLINNCPEQPKNIFSRVTLEA